MIISQLLSDLPPERKQHACIIDRFGHYSFAELEADARSLAIALSDMAPAGSTVAFMLPNWRETARIYLAATFAGMVALPILPTLRHRELAFMLEDSATRVVFIPDQFRGCDYPDMLKRVCKDLVEPPRVIIVRPGHDWAPVPLRGFRTVLPQPEPDDVRMLMYTSGTTGRPKGVMHTHRSIAALIGQIGKYWRVGSDDRFLVASPISHIGGSIYVFETPIMLGTSAILMEQWSAPEAVRLADQEHWTHMAGATPFLEQLLSAARAAQTRLPRLKVFICGGAAVPEALIRDASGYFDHALVTRVYGSTEVPVATVGSFDGIDAAARTDGLPGIATIRIVSHPAAAPGDGEIRVNGPQMCVGYLRTEDNSAAFDEQGFFRTGDLGHCTPDGHLVVTGRAKDIIIRNGENISAAEIEALLIEHPSIREIAVIGLPDTRTGERACAVVVAEPGMTPSLLDLVEFLEQRQIAKFKLPEAIEIVDALPRNDAGKVLKTLLRQRFSPAQADREGNTG